MTRVDWLITQLSVIGGAEKFVTDVVPYLSYRGWKIRVISLFKDSIFIDQLRANNIPVIELASTTRNPIRLIHRLLKEWKIDPPKIVHTHLFHAGMIGRSCAKFAGIERVIVHQHGPEQNRFFSRTILDRVTHRLVTRYICSCQAVAQVLNEREKIPQSKISIIHNGINSNIERSPESKPDGWPIPPSKICIGTASRLSPEKGHSYLLLAFSKIINLGYDAYCLILGEGQLLKELNQEAVDLSINERVFFPGQVKDVYPWLRHFDIFVLPSLWEGIPLAMLEAMAMGLPVIASNVGGIPEVIQKPDFGLLVPPKDPNAMANEMIKLLNNQHLRKKIGECGKKHVVDNFSIDSTVDNLDQLYKKVLNEDG
jgi:glycosyltransferase involved in cell wall biosynthesis